MKKLIGLTAFLLFFHCSGLVFATGICPEIIYDGDNKVVSLSTGNADGDSSWMWLSFDEIVDTSVHKKVTVSFDMYRNYPQVAGSGHQQLNWAFVDESESGYWDMTPFYGVSERYGEEDGGRYQIYPFGWNGDYINYHADTVFDRWVNVTLEWDFAKTLNGYTGWASAWYNSTAIILNEKIYGAEKFLAGWDMTLWAPYASDPNIEGGAETVLIDNLVITGSDIYNSNGFEGFELGLLSGQDGWVAGTEQGTTPPVPEPTTIMLFGVGLAGLAGVKHRISRTPKRHSNIKV